MYRLLPYNNNCVLDIENGKVVFERDYEYDSFLKWKSHNPVAFEFELKKRDAQVRHNGGQKHVKENDSFIVEKLYHQNGQLFNEVVYSKDKDILEEHEYFLNDEEYSDEDCIWRSRYYSKNSKVRELEFYPSGQLRRKTEYSNINEVVNKEEIHFYENGVTNKAFVYSSYDGEKYFLTEMQIYDVGGKRLSKSQYQIKDNRSQLTESCAFFPTVNNQLFKKYTIQEDKSLSYSEYFINGAKRVEGKLDNKHNMTGKWVFYYDNTYKEAEYTFRKGDITNATIYYEDGTLIESYEF